MSMIFMTDELRNELYPVSEIEGPGRFKRLDQIKRTSINFFHAYSDKPLGQEIDFLEPFQDVHDAYNEFRGIFIKPLMCDYLAAKHALNLSLELSLLAIHVCTLSFDKVPEALVDVLAEAVFTLGYLINSVVTDATVIPVFFLRAIATLANALVQLFSSKEEYSAIYTNYMLSQLPSADTTELDPLHENAVMATVVSSDDFKEVSPRL